MISPLELILKHTQVINKTKEKKKSNKSSFFFFAFSFPLSTND